MMFGERPDDEMAIEHVAGRPWHWSWYANTSSNVRSLAIAVMSSTLLLRLTTRGDSPVLARTPFT